MSNLSTTNQTLTKLIGRPDYPKDTKSLMEVYTKWASRYDQDITAVGTTDNSNAIKEVFEFIQNDESCLMLDIGCGTGLTAQAYREAGFVGQIDGIDMTDAMLNVAREKDLYRKLFLHTITEDKPLPVKDDSYDVMTAGGALTKNHLTYGCMKPMVDALKPGGLLIFTSRSDEDCEEYVSGLRDYAGDMAEKKLIRLEKDALFIYNIIDSKPTPGTVCVYRKL